MAMSSGDKVAKRSSQYDLKVTTTDHFTIQDKYTYRGLLVQSLIHFYNR